MIPMTVVIMTKNEQSRLPACLASLENAFAQVVVVDSHSTDETQSIAHAHGAMVLNFSWNGQYPKKKQWCLENIPSAQDWFLYVDADERLTPELIAEIKQTNWGAANHAGGYWISADPIWNGQRLRHGQSNHKLCLLHRRRAHFPVADDLDTPKNEVEGHYQPILSGGAKSFSARMLHDCDPISGWFRRHVHYAEVAAIMRDRALSNHETGWRAACKRIFYHLPFQGLILFAYGYLWRRGFLDGLAGFDYAAARGWYYELTALFRRNRKKR